MTALLPCDGAYNEKPNRALPHRFRDTNEE
jgi:hypothetical protein